MAVREGKSGKRRVSSAKERPKFPTKVVVRRLPPDMTVDKFRQQVAPLPAHDHLWLSPSDASLAALSFCRVYVGFVDIDGVISFCQRFDGYVFLSEKGEEYPAVVEFAPNQRVPHIKGGGGGGGGGSLCDDADYAAFVGADEQAPLPPPSWQHNLQLIEQRDKQRKEVGDEGIVTPLVSFLSGRGRGELRRDARVRHADRRAKHDPPTATRDKHPSLGVSSRRAAHNNAATPASTSDSVATASHLSQAAASSPPPAASSPASSSSTSTATAAAAAASQPGATACKNSVRREKLSHTPAVSASANKDQTPRAAKSGAAGGSRRQRGGPQPPVSATISDNNRESIGESAVVIKCKPALSATARQTAAVGDDAVPDSNEGGGGATDATARPTHKYSSQRKIRNKDRPAMTIYRPGMGKYSSRRRVDPDTAACEEPTGAGAADSGGGAWRGSRNARDADTRQHGASGTVVFRRSR